ncbi:MAG: hypothetical protein AB1705_17295 [Verrucomicrobiota bacterium]
MRRVLALLLLLGLPFVSEAATTARIVKVLPHLLDKQGRHALSPSLYERDAYQSVLRANPELCSGLRFDVQWRGTGLSKKNLRMKVEIRAGASSLGQPVVIEQPVKPNGILGYWAAVTLDGEAYQKAGKIVAWRVTLWDGDTQLAEQKSFLW